MNNLKNIIIVYDCANINGGAAKVAIQSAIALSKQEYNVFFFAASKPIDSGLEASKVNIKCLDIKDINHSGKFRAVTNGIWNNIVKKEFVSFLDKFSAEDTVVHIHGWVKALTSAVVKVSCKKGFKTLITLHDYFTVCPNGGFYDFQKQKICTMTPMSLTCMFCNCDKRSFAQKVWRVARQIVQDRNVRFNKNIAFVSISQKNEEVVRPFVKSHKFYRVDNPIKLADHQIDDCSKSNVYLFVGRLSEEKGIDLFCRAITELKKEYDIQGIVVGDGVLLEQLRKDYPLISFEGWKSTGEVQDYIQKARALVFPSRCYEGAPLTILEAMSAGLPCIVSDCTSATEIISDRKNGFVFETDSIRSLHESLRFTLDNGVIREVSDEIKNNMDYSHYSDQSHVRQLINVYNDFIVS